MAEAKTNEPTQDAIDAFSLAMIVQAKRVKDKKQGDLKTAYNTASLRGLNTDAGKEAIKLYGQGGEAIETFFLNVQKIARYLKLLGRDLSPAQYEMFGEKRGPAPEDERAAIEGRAAGFDLDPEMSEEKNPYEIGSIKGQAWLSAFRQALSERNAIMSMPAPVDAEGDEGDDE